MSDITNRLAALGYDRKGSFKEGFISGEKPFGERGYSVFMILMEVAQGEEVAAKRCYPNPPDLNSWQQNLTVEEMELALEIIYCYREWKSEGGCAKCMHYDKEDFKCTSSLKGDCHV